MDERRKRTILSWAILAGAMLFVAVESHLKAPPEAWMLERTNNPDNFFIWTTNGASYLHTFTYDPHAADDWLRETGAASDLSSNGWKMGRGHGL